MKVRRAGIVVVVLVMTIVLSNFLTTTVSTKKYSESYPAVACPPSASGLSAEVSAGSRNALYRKIAGKVEVLTPVKSSLFKIANDPILLDGADITSVTWQSQVGIWAGATLCTSPQGEQWFVGGTADITSKGRLLLVNSGLSEAIVDVAIWSENGAQSDTVLTVRANSFIKVGLDSIAAGQSRLSIRVMPRSGRVSAFMVDERVKGLQRLGGDFVNSVGSPATDFVISGIPHQILKGKESSHVLRILAPGSADANIQVDLISKDGVFTPVGLDGRDIQKGAVTDIVLNPMITASAFSLRIRSDQPVVAGVFSPFTISGHRDFLWNSATARLVPMTLAINGLAVTLIFTGETINLKIQTRLSSGKVENSTITGSDIAIWKAPSNSATVKISDIRSSVYGGGLMTSPSGIGFFPLVPGSALTRAAIPISNIWVINR